jgi:hypothetical protein
MKKRTQTSIDGFIPRRPGAQLGSLHEREEEEPIDRSLHTGNSDAREVVGAPRESKIIGRSDIDDSLREIDDPAAPGDNDVPKRSAIKKRAKSQRAKQSALLSGY